MLTVEQVNGFLSEKDAAIIAAEDKLIETAMMKGKNSVPAGVSGLDMNPRVLTGIVGMYLEGGWDLRIEAKTEDGHCYSVWSWKPIR
jgi:hypothetical protein